MLSVLAAFLSTTTVLAASLADIEHVVLFMQENRAFDHYFGTLYGVRGFQDPNVQINPNGLPAFYNLVNSSLTNATDYLLPWHLNAQGGLYLNGTQCLEGGSNGWANNHAAVGNGTNDLWALMNSPYSLGYFKRSDLPIQYAIADGWTIADMYQEGVMAATLPNRVLWQSGSINVPGGNVNSTQGPALDNNQTPGCDTLTMVDFIGGGETDTSMPVSCFPYDWKTIPEYLEEMNVSWWTYQAYDNFDDNPAAYFKVYLDLSSNPANDSASDLVVRALTMDWDGTGDWAGGLDHFMADAAAGTLPAVSYIIGPMELSEHPPYTPRQGAWLQKQVVDAVQSSPKYNSTILLISFDETGGWGDHVVPFHSPEETPGEWIINPFTNMTTFAGPGFRLPFYAISPYTRGGNVFTEAADHTSQIMFLEKWLAARGTPFISAEINTWRREHMSDLVNLFDFDNPDASYVSLPDSETPYTDPLTGLLYGAEYCEARYEGYVTPEVPYGMQTAAESLAVESGFRSIRGGLTEGRYIVLEAGNVALSWARGLAVSPTQAQKQAVASQRFVVHAVDSTQADATLFNLSTSATSDALYVTAQLGLDSMEKGAIWNITYQGASNGYFIQDTSSGMYLTLNAQKPVLGTNPEGVSLFSVTGA